MRSGSCQIVPHSNVHVIAHAELIFQIYILLMHDLLACVPPTACHMFLLESRFFALAQHHIVLSQPILGCQSLIPNIALIAVCCDPKGTHTRPT